VVVTVGASIAPDEVVVMAPATCPLTLPLTAGFDLGVVESISAALAP
jgi:hypothetical protein